jgi:hypothetical protein
MPEPLAILQACSAALRAAAAGRGPKGLVERDFQRAVEQASGARSAGTRLSRWPSVGAVDVMLPDRVALELKWCKRGDTLARTGGSFAVRSRESVFRYAVGTLVVPALALSVGLPQRG